MFVCSDMQMHADCGMSAVHVCLWLAQGCGLWSSRVVIRAVDVGVHTAIRAVGIRINSWPQGLHTFLPGRSIHVHCINVAQRAQTDAHARITYPPYRHTQLRAFVCLC